MKKKVALIVLVLSVVGVGLGYRSYRNFMKNAMNKEALALINGVSASAEAAKAEIGYYPKTFAEIGFQPAGELNVVVKYLSSRDAFKVSARHKKTGYAVSKDSGGKVYQKDILENSPNVQLLGQKLGYQ